MRHFEHNGIEYAWRFNEWDDQTEVFKVIRDRDGIEHYELVATGEEASEMVHSWCYGVRA